jgi:predicted ester cyclase
VSAHEVVAAYWAAAEARDWDTFGELIAEDVVYEMAQTGERVRGRDAYVRFNRDGFPGDWHLAVRRIVAEGSAAASWIDFSEEGVTETGLCFFELDADGRIARVSDAWPQPYEPPSDRAGLVERFQPGDH